MKKLFNNIAISLTAGLLALLSMTSCGNIDSDFDEKSCEAFLTCYYAGGFEAEMSEETYHIKGYLSNKEIEDIFYDLIEEVTPGFYAALLEIDFYNWMDDFSHTDVYDFWWEPTNDLTGEGYYAWDERDD